MPADRPWTAAAVPSQTGRTALVTGANSGIGFEVASVLAARGARVLLGCRDTAKGKEAAARILSLQPQADVDCVPLDLADLKSVESCARATGDLTGHLDLLVNNAGVMVPPLSRTQQGFESQLGINHLGHFALTGLLLPLLLRGQERCPERRPEHDQNARIAVVTSIASHFGRIDFQDLQFKQRPYKPWDAYGQSKLANLLFALELARRLKAAGTAVHATAAHPGVAATNLQRHSSFLRHFVNPLVMTPLEGALPILRATTDPLAASGSFWGPSRLGETRGPPAPARLPRQARDPEIARRLWEVSEQLTGVRFPLGEPTAAMR